MTAEERARDIFELIRSGEGSFVALEHIRAALQERDARWREAMLEGLGKGAVAAITLSGHPAVAALRALLEEASAASAPKPPPEASKP